MGKLADWTDEELDELASVFEVCYSEGMLPSTEIDQELLDELEERDLDEPWWAKVKRQGEE